MQKQILNSEDSPNKLKLGLYLAIGMISFGFAPILVKFKPEISSPLTVAAFRTALAAILLLPFWIYKERKEIRSLSIRQVSLMALAGTFLALHFILWIASLSFTSVASASVLVTIHPVIIILIERLLFKRSYDWTAWLGVFVAFTGVAFLSWLDLNEAVKFPKANTGNLLAFLAAISFVGYFFLGERIRKTHEFSWIGYVFPLYFFSAVVCALVLSVYDLSQWQLISNPQLLVVAILLALGPQILGHGSLNYAVKYVRPTLLSSLILFEPALSAVMAIIIFVEIPTILQFVALSMIVSGISLTWVKKLFSKKHVKNSY